jgi:ABC-type antimicrobial peptide transport system permease subunit
MNRIRSLIWSALLTALSNRKRYLLTISGIALSTFLFVFVQFILQVPLQVDFVKYKSFPSDSILVTGAFTYDDEYLTVADQNVYKYSRIGAPLTFSLEDVGHGNATYLVGYGVTDNFLDFPVISMDYPDSLEVTTLLYGRSFNSDDIALLRQIVIIDVATSTYLFGDDNGVGKFVRLSWKDFTGEFLVVGVVMNTQSAWIKQIHIANRDESDTEDPIFLQVFVPISTLEYIGHISVSAFIVRTPYALDSIVPVLTQKFGDVATKVYTFENHYQIFQENSTIKDQFTLVIQVIIIALSAFSMAVSQLFSLKSRTFEIGIKKAIGADDIDILFQFQIESLMTGLCGALIGAIFGAFIAAVVSLYMSLQVGSMLLSIRFALLFEDIVIVIGMAMVATLIPSYLASKQNIILSLRID